MFTDRDALARTCVASQVCRQWRELMLAMPSLWAKLIDMDEISRRTGHEWRDELVQRSGAALLWIRAESSGRVGARANPRERHIVQFFFDLVTGNWHRIQKLVLSSYSRFELTRSMLCFPAPQLEHCVAPFGPAAGVQNEASSTEPLFANHVPKLRTVHLSRCLFNRKAPWLYYLHSMTFDGTYTVPDSLTILSTMPRLQELKRGVFLIVTSTHTSQLYPSYT